MGGDFILDSEGVVRFMYPSQTSADRPSVHLLIEELKVTDIDCIICYSLYLSVSSYKE